MRSAEDLEVYLELTTDAPVRVGWLKGVNARKFRDSRSILLGKERQHFDLKVFTVTDFDLKRTSGFTIADLSIPPYALGRPRPMANETIFTWTVLSLTYIDDYEWVFDLPEFEPVDTEEDRNPELDLIPVFHVDSKMIIDGSVVADKLTWSGGLFDVSSLKTPYTDLTKPSPK